MEQGLYDITSDVQVMTRSVATDDRISARDLRRVLRFISDVSRVVVQAFENVYEVLIDLKFVSSRDIESGELDRIRKDLDKVRARDYYRNVEMICGQLHVLEDEFRDEISSITSRLDDPGQWRSVFSLLNEHEGRIIRLVDDSVEELNVMLKGPLDEAALAAIRDVAATKASALAQSLGTLQAQRSRILGLSGRHGFLELTETNRSELAQEATTTIHGQQVIYVRQAVDSVFSDFMNGDGTMTGHQGGSPRFVTHATNVSITSMEKVVDSTVSNFQNQYIGSAASPEAAKELLQLIEMIRGSQELSSEEKVEATAAINEVGKQISAPAPNKPNKLMVENILKGVEQLVSNAADIAGPATAIIARILPLLALA
jgi:hypothetical protein